MRRLETLLLGVIMSFTLASQAHATIFSTTASAFAGDPLDVLIEVDDESDPGNLVIRLSIASEDDAGDLRGFFAQVTDETLLSGLSLLDVDSVISNAVFESDGVVRVGGGNNVNGGGSPCPCDLGVEIGSPGVGRDDYRDVTFTLTHATEALTVDLFQAQTVGVRVTSVGDLGGDRNGSSKLIAVVPEPSTALLMALGFAGLSSIRPRSGRR